MKGWIALACLCVASGASALPVAEHTAQQAPAMRESPKGIVLPPSVLSTQPIPEDNDDSASSSQSGSSHRQLATASGTDEANRATAAREIDDWVLWVGGLVAVFVALQLAFDTLDFSVFGIDSRGRRRRLLREEDYQP